MGERFLGKEQKIKAFNRKGHEERREDIFRQKEKSRHELTLITQIGIKKKIRHGDKERGLF
jgi:hypothetical protein